MLNTYDKVSFRNIPIRERDLEKIERAKIIFEKDFHGRVSWSDFFMTLVTGYCLGRSVLVNENKFNLLLEEEPLLQSHHHQRDHQDKKPG